MYLVTSPFLNGLPDGCFSEFLMFLPWQLTEMNSEDELKRQEVKLMLMSKYHDILFKWMFKYGSFTKLLLMAPPLARTG